MSDKSSRSAVTQDKCQEKKMVLTFLLVGLYLIFDVAAISFDSLPDVATTDDAVELFIFSRAM